MKKHWESHIVQETEKYNFSTQDLKRPHSPEFEYYKMTEGFQLLFWARLKIKSLVLRKDIFYVYLKFSFPDLSQKELKEHLKSISSVQLWLSSTSYFYD